MLTPEDERMLALIRTKTATQTQPDAAHVTYLLSLIDRIRAGTPALDETKVRSIVMQVLRETSLLLTQDDAAKAAAQWSTAPAQQTRPANDKCETCVVPPVHAEPQLRR